MRAGGWLAARLGLVGAVYRDVCVCVCVCVCVWRVAARLGLVGAVDPVRREVEAAVRRRHVAVEEQHVGHAPQHHQLRACVCVRACVGVCVCVCVCVRARARALCYHEGVRALACARTGRASKAQA